MRILTILVLIYTFATVDFVSAQSAQDIVSAMVTAHGGIAKWRSAPTVSFEDSFLPTGEKTPEVSNVTVEQGRRRAYIDFPVTKSRMAWDGRQAWSENWKAPYPPRFAALLNYYFLNLPWLSMDRGVNLGNPGKAKLWNEPTEYITVKMTFTPGTGDTPDDYYILYIDPKNHRLKGCEYIATYSAILPPKTKSTPPSILVYDEFTTVDGLVVPTRYSIYNKQSHALLGTCNVRNWSFKKAFDPNRLNKPATAVIDTSIP